MFLVGILQFTMQSKIMPALAYSIFIIVRGLTTKEAPLRLHGVCAAACLTGRTTQALKIASLHSETQSSEPYITLYELYMTSI